LVLFFISLLVANWAVKPVEQAFLKQKQFVADASHELKTPLTTIAMNTDVVLSNPKETVESQSKWLHYIKDETKRMTALTLDLLYLTKVDSAEQDDPPREYSLSDTVLQGALPFESVIYESNRSFQMEVEPKIMALGHEDRLKQAIAILLDNAVK